MPLVAAATVRYWMHLYGHILIDLFRGFLFYNGEERKKIASIYLPGLFLSLTSLSPGNNKVSFFQFTTPARWSIKGAVAAARMNKNM